MDFVLLLFTGLTGCATAQQTRLPAAETAPIFQRVLPATEKRLPDSVAELLKDYGDRYCQVMRRSFEEALSTSEQKRLGAQEIRLSKRLCEERAFLSYPGVMDRNEKIFVGVYGVLDAASRALRILKKSAARQELGWVRAELSESFVDQVDPALEILFGKRFSVTEARPYYDELKDYAVKFNAWAAGAVE